MDARGFLFFLLLTVTCSDLLQAQPQEGGSESNSRSGVDELKNITLTILKEFLSFSASVKADLTALKLNFTSLQSELGQVADTVITNKRKIKAQGAILDGFQSKLDSVQHAVERGILDHGEQLFNQTSALVSQLSDHQLDSMQAVERDIINQGERLFNQTSALVHQLADQQLDRIQVVERDVLDQGEQIFNQTSALVSQLAHRQDVLYHNLSMEVQACTTEPRAESPTEENYSCGGSSGWRRVAFLNMTDPTHQCPSGWRLTDYSKRTCGRASTSQRTCDSATFSTGQLNYSRVCGQLVAYQFGAISAFYGSSRNIESHYVNGLSLTHGIPRQHVWTFAGGVAESGNRHMNERCPCDGGTSPVPNFVGNDYYCESGINGPWVSSQFIFHPEDHLWDGEDCVPASSCCEGAALPYFVKELGGSTTDDIETRICSYYSRIHSDTAIELVELYVQ